MPPKKRQRVGAKVAGAGLEKVGDVAPACLELKSWICDVYAGRHGYPDDGKKKFPLVAGGSFLDVVQRCWSDESSMVTLSCEFCKKIGLIKCDSSEDYFGEKFLAMKE